MSVYTHISKSQLNALLRQYPQIGTLVDYKGITEGIENTNYFVNTTVGKFVLTIFEQHCFEDLYFFLDLMAFVSETGLPVPHPIVDSQGKYLQEFDKKPATLITCLKGATVQNPSLEQCRSLGTMLAKLHTVTAKFKHTKKNERDLDWCLSTARKVAARMEPEDYRILEQELDYQQAHPLVNIPQGIIHADLFRDNVLFEGNRLTGLIDFYYACSGTFIYDLAVTVNDWCIQENSALDTDKYQALMQAYQQHRSLNSEEVRQWNTALRLGAARFWLSRLNDYYFPRTGHLTHIKNPNAMKAILLGHRKQTR